MVMRTCPGTIPQDHTCILLYLPGVSAYLASYSRHGIDDRLEKMLHMWMLCEPHRP